MAANNKEHEEFRRRLKEHDQKLGQLNELTVAISRLTDANVNVTKVLEQVKTSVQRLDARLANIEKEPGEKWKKITFEIVKYVVLAAVGVAAGYFIKG
nr:MAG TPA: hemolysin [Caudoviricetes sp.]